MAELIRTFSHHCRSRYGEAIGKIPIDVGLVCPNRQHGGCIYCRAASFTPACLDKVDDVLTQVKRGKESLLKGRFRKYFAYFQQETCTAASVDQLMGQFRLLLADVDCVGLILSTRPDAVDKALLEPLAALLIHSKKDCLFELGLQSVHEKSLRYLNRNHTFDDFIQSFHLIKRYTCFEVGVHLIFGIPGESEDEMLESVQTLGTLGIDAIKLHHLQVIRETQLERLYEEGMVQTFTLESYIELLMRVIAIIPANVTIHRLWATAHPRHLVAPKWNVLAGLLSEKLRARMREEGTYQGKALE
ncbi:TIGR01212 family radical SAM protein [Desulforhopalus sp. 52FAK]